ncbi:MAG: FAD binding domain-containing protein [Gemmataceae bacterium]|nr:FAD binding domain-containing protein [Gemmataceae bacterium]
MRNYVLFYVNGRRYQIHGETAFASLSDFLRHELDLTGTKVVCAEGDCGACTVLVGRSDAGDLRYETVDACIQFLYQLDCKHVVTVEGLRTDRQLHPVQQALVEHHGSQCGYCTPGFVMALTGCFERQAGMDRDMLRTALTGNLCRCTGYLPILEAGLAVDPAALRPLADQYQSAPMLEDFCTHAGSPVLIQCPCAPWGNGPARRTFFSPRCLEDAIAFKTRNPEAVIVSGGTELGVLRNKTGYDPPTLLSLAHVPGLAEITGADETVAIGASVTWTQVEAFAKEVLPEFYKIILRFGSPQIRNVATLVANIAHGSPIADSLPFLMVMDAELELFGRAGSRHVKINGFYRGYKIKDLGPDEIITRVVIPLPAADELLKLYKVSRRNDLDIASFGAAIRIRRAGDMITRAYVAYSGVGPTVVRLPTTEAFLQGKLLVEETFREAGRLACTEIQPISDVRGSRDFRLLLAENILVKFYFECVEAQPQVKTP